MQFHCVRVNPSPLLSLKSQLFNAFRLLQIFPAVLRALKNKVARLALTSELAPYVNSNRSLLEHQQFDLVVKLLNCALQVRAIASHSLCCIPTQFIAPHLSLLF